jgi:hypothetical protein
MINTQPGEPDCRKVDVFARDGRFLKTYRINFIPINYRCAWPEFLQQALVLARDERLVPGEQLKGLVARRHIACGPLRRRRGRWA